MAKKSSTTKAKKPVRVSLAEIRAAYKATGWIPRCKIFYFAKPEDPTCEACPIATLAKVGGMNLHDNVTLKELATFLVLPEHYVLGFTHAFDAEVSEPNDGQRYGKHYLVGREDGDAARQALNPAPGDREQ